MKRQVVAPPWLRGARVAFVFLSRIPVGGHQYRTEDRRWAPAYFTLVGLLIGGVMAAVYVLARPFGLLVAAT